MNRLIMLCVAFMFVFLMSVPTWASKAYVTDTLNINLYDGPNTESKIIGALSSGEAIEIIISDVEWSFIRPLEQGDESLSGFVQNYYLMDRIPWKMKALPLKDENMQMSERLLNSEKEFNDVILQRETLTRNLHDSTEALRELRGRYDSLRMNAGDYLKLNAAYKSTMSDLQTVQQTIGSLSLENERLQSSQWKRLFIAEGLVLLCGLIIGLAVGRLEKKSKALIYY